LEKAGPRTARSESDALPTPCGSRTRTSTTTRTRRRSKGGIYSGYFRLFHIIPPLGDLFLFSRNGGRRDVFGAAAFPRGHHTTLGAGVVPGVRNPTVIDLRYTGRWDFQLERRENSQLFPPFPPLTAFGAYSFVVHFRDTGMEESGPVRPGQGKRMKGEFCVLIPDRIGTGCDPVEPRGTRRAGDFPLYFCAGGE
jgi:hypothetical protein